MPRFSLMLLALSIFAADPLAAIQDLPPRGPFSPMDAMQPLLKMKVYLKGGSRNPPLDSFRLAQGESEIWRWENEWVFFKKGRKVAHRLADIDSVVLENQLLRLGLGCHRPSQLPEERGWRPESRLYLDHTRHGGG